MKVSKRLSKIFESSKQIAFDDDSKIVLMSDCHRGDGSPADSFSKNQNICFAALTYYYKENYVYIELGDGDELWENRKVPRIIGAHKDIFWILTKFYYENRLFFIFGNHDLVKKRDKFMRQNYYRYFDTKKNRYLPLFKGIKAHEGLILKQKTRDRKIFLVHGHQVDFFNDSLWKVSRFLVRYLWKPLELFGVNDPTSTAKNYRKKELIEKKLIKWVEEYNQMLIAGHTHRPVFPDVWEPAYFNDGSCVHPRGITAIEIAKGEITLVKWSVKTKHDGALFIGRERLAGPKQIQDYFK